MTIAKNYIVCLKRNKITSCSETIQGVIETCTDILTTSYWFHIELTRKKYLKNSMAKDKMTFIFGATIFFNWF
jgi:hypothetical protein